MEERRKVQRYRTLKAGSIAFNRAGAIDCRVRNLSLAGAYLEVASQIGIPDQFVLLVEVDCLRHPCHVIWRTATSHGRGVRRQGGLTPSKARAAANLAASRIMRRRRHASYLIHRNFAPLRDRSGFVANGPHN